MEEIVPDRRQLLAAAGLLAAAVPVATAAAAQSPTAATSTFAPRPLPFDPKSVPGLSEKLLVSHHDNNYAGAVRRLGAIRGQFAALDPATAPVFTINGLKREELIAWNSMILHEVYFAGFGPSAGGCGGLPPGFLPVAAVLAASELPANEKVAGVLALAGAAPPNCGVVVVLARSEPPPNEKAGAGLAAPDLSSAAGVDTTVAAAVVVEDASGFAAVDDDAAVSPTF